MAKVENSVSPLVTRSLYSRKRFPLQEYILKFMQFAEENKDTIVIADEIGNGIVPLDAFEREYREQTGRAEILLAKKADEVVRVICGIGQKIK